MNKVILDIVRNHGKPDCDGCYHLIKHINSLEHNFTQLDGFICNARIYIESTDPDVVRVADNWLSGDPRLKHKTDAELNAEVDAKIREWRSERKMP